MKVRAKLVASLFWVAFVVWGAWKIEHRQHKPASSATPAPVSDCLTAAQKKEMPHLVARRDMRVNWRIRISDLYQPTAPGAPALGDFVGKHLGCRVSAGDAVVLSELRPRPELSPATGKALYLLALQNREEEWLNAGEHVDLFPGPTAVVSNAEVLAVICDSGCDAVSQLTPAEIELLKLTNPLRLKTIFR